MGAVIVNDDGAINGMLLGAPAMKEYPITMIVKVVLLLLMMMIIPIEVTLVGIVIDVNDVAA